MIHICLVSSDHCYNIAPANSNNAGTHCCDVHPHVITFTFPSTDWVAARELVREVDYTLRTLSSSLLGESRTEVPAAELPARYDSSQSLHQLLLLGESDAWLALGLAFQLAGK